MTINNENCELFRYYCRPRKRQPRRAMLEAAGALTLLVGSLMVPSKCSKLFGLRVAAGRKILIDEIRAKCIHEGPERAVQALELQGTIWQVTGWAHQGRQGSSEKGNIGWDARGGVARVRKGPGKSVGGWS